MHLQPGGVVAASTVRLARKQCGQIDEPVGIQDNLEWDIRERAGGVRRLGRCLL